MMGGVFSKNIFLVRFQDGSKNNMISNILIIVTVESIPETEESDFSTIYLMPV